ncbi:MAG: histidine kinase [Chitinophagaceae bacterium]
MHTETKNTKQLRVNEKSIFQIVQIVGWLCYFLIIWLIQLTMGNGPTRATYIVAIAETVIGYFITNAIRKRIIKHNILNRSFSAQVVQLIYLTLSYSLIYSVLYMIVFVFTRYYKYDARYSLIGRWFIQWIFTIVLILIWNLLYFSYHYVKKSNSEALAKARLENTIKDLELNTIKAHINPHFIFNALNSIRALVEEDPQRARLAITELSNLLRSSMQVEKRKTTTLQEELRIVNDYLALESIRFEDRLHVQTRIDEDLLSQEIPPMSLQTLVENAIKHGISKEINGGEIEIIAFPKLENCYIEVKNTGKIHRYNNSEGFGIKSTTDRLALLFGDKASFSLMQNTDNQVTATMKIPLSIKA